MLFYYYCCCYYLFLASKDFSRAHTQGIALRSLCDGYSCIRYACMWVSECVCECMENRQRTERMKTIELSPTLTHACVWLLMVGRSSTLSPLSSMVVVVVVLFDGTVADSDSAAVHTALLLLAEGVEFHDEFSDCKRIVYFVNVATAHAIVPYYNPITRCHRPYNDNEEKSNSSLRFGMRILCTRYSHNIPYCLKASLFCLNAFHSFDDAAECV